MSFKTRPKMKKQIAIQKYHTRKTIAYKSRPNQNIIHLHKNAHFNNNRVHKKTLTRAN